jgi:hypothetical protein
MRTSALAAAKGYRSSLIAGEEPELCVRLRAARVDQRMVVGPRIAAPRVRLRFVDRARRLDGVCDLSPAGGAPGAARRSIDARELVACCFPDHRQVPEMLGQAKFIADRAFGSRSKLIEYK